METSSFSHVKQISHSANILYYVAQLLFSFKRKLKTKQVVWLHVVTMLWFSKPLICLSYIITNWQENSKRQDKASCQTVNSQIMAIFELFSCYNKLQKCWDTLTKTQLFLLQIAASHRSVRQNTDLPPPSHSKLFLQVLSLILYC